MNELKWIPVGSEKIHNTTCYLLPIRENQPLRKLNLGHQGKWTFESFEYFNVIIFYNLIESELSPAYQSLEHFS